MTVPSVMTTSPTNTVPFRVAVATIWALSGPEHSIDASSSSPLNRIRRAEAWSSTRRVGHRSGCETAKVLWVQASKMLLKFFGAHDDVGFERFRKFKVQLRSRFLVDNLDCGLL